MDERPIGVFDSGVGGLTVVKAIRERLPHESIIYIGDTARVPYGTRSRSTITSFASEIARMLLSKNVKALVVACNTISATCLADVRALSHIPVVGVIEPTVAAAVQQSETKQIAVIGTPATIRSGIYERRLKQLDPGCMVSSIATPLFVPIIEEGLHEHRVVDVMIETYLSPLRAVREVDTLILGCTHYPLIARKIQNYVGSLVRVLDSALPTAYALQQLLCEQQLEADHGSPTQVYFTSDEPDKAMSLAKDFLGSNLELHRIALQSTQS